MERLQKVMASCGIASRRKSEELILNGKVRVNGKVITEVGCKVDPIRDIIEVEGKRIIPVQQHTYIILNKPKGVITSVTDPQGRKTVIDLLKDIPDRVYPVGRLDYQTEGLLLLTNDGELAYRMTHPKYEIEKEYIALVKGKPTQKAIQQLRSGIMLDDGMTAPAQVELLSNGEKENSKLKLVIHEGRNRQVRRMCEAIGHPVLHLRRMRIGFIELNGLKPGEFRHLEEQEVKKLKQLLKINSFTS